MKALLHLKNMGIVDRWQLTVDREDGQRPTDNGQLEVRRPTSLPQRFSAPDEVAAMIVRAIA